MRVLFSALAVAIPITGALGKVVAALIGKILGVQEPEDTDGDRAIQAKKRALAQKITISGSIQRQSRVLNLTQNVLLKLATLTKNLQGLQRRHGRMKKNLV